MSRISPPWLHLMFSGVGRATCFAVVADDQSGDAGHVFHAEHHDRVVGAADGEAPFGGRRADAGAVVVVEGVVESLVDPVGQG